MGHVWECDSCDYLNGFEELERGLRTWWAAFETRCCDDDQTLTLDDNISQPGEMVTGYAAKLGVVPC
jgi:hypothetical protein